ncbi:MAG: hypothetical protein ACK4WM_07990 [Thermoflexales bacterium]
MQKIRFLSMLVLAIVIASLVTSVAYAYAAYHGSWSERPYWGNWWWYNNDPSSLYLKWYIDDAWTSSGAASLHDGHNRWPYKEYRFEQEAYNPGAGTSCDRLHAHWVNPYQLPVTGYSIRNGCGGSTIKELVHLELDENAVSSGTWYRHWIIYRKYGSGSGGDGEVNYSFSHNWTWGDDWLGKVVYDQWFNKRYSDPSGLVN